MSEILLEKDLQKAADFLKAGKLVAFPTETVYGLGASVFLPESIEEIFSVKKRPQDNPLIVHLGDLEDAQLVAQNLPETFFSLAKRFFPGPLTLIVKKGPAVPEIVSAGLDTIALRIPDHLIARELIRRAGAPLVAPSANLSGKPSSTTAKHVQSDFDGAIAAIVDGGPCQYGMESTVIDLVSFETPTLLRPGALAKESIEKALGFPIPLYESGPKSSPGMKYRHYAPEVPVYLIQKKEELEKLLANGKRALLLSSEQLSIDHLELKPQTLYSHLRLADEKGYDEILIFSPKPLEAAIQNRLEKVCCESCYY